MKESPCSTSRRHGGPPGTSGRGLQHCRGFQPVIHSFIAYVPLVSSLLWLTCIPDALMQMSSCTLPFKSGHPTKQPAVSLSATRRLAARAAGMLASRSGTPVVDADAAHVPEVHRRDAVPRLYLILPPDAQRVERWCHWCWLVTLASRKGRIRSRHMN